jgi:hypothetical protein
MGATAPTHRPAANCEDSNLRDSCQSWSTMKGGEQSMLSALTHTQMLLPPSRPPPRASTERAEPTWALAGCEVPRNRTAAW